MATPGRQRVLDAALTLFSERGFATTSMRQLAEHVGLQAGSLYSHYPGGKDDLLAAALQPFLDGIDVLLRLDHEQLDLDAWIHTYASHLAAHQPAVRLAGADLAVARHAMIATQLSDTNSRTRELLRRHSTLTDPQAAALLGQLWWPIICLPNALTDAEISTLADSAADVAKRATGA